MAQELAHKYQLPAWVEHNNPLLKKGITKIVKDYVRSNHKMLNYYQNRLEVQEGVTTRKQSLDHSRQSTSPKISAKKIKEVVKSPTITKPTEPSKSSWMSKFERPKTLEELNAIKELAKQEEVVP